jgi:hypothetical protein
LIDGMPVRVLAPVTDRLLVCTVCGSSLLGRRASVSGIVSCFPEGGELGGAFVPEFLGLELLVASVAPLAVFGDGGAAIEAMTCWFRWRVLAGRFVAAEVVSSGSAVRFGKWCSDPPEVRPRCIGEDSYHLFNDRCDSGCPCWGGFGQDVGEGWEYPAYSAFGFVEV